MGEGTLIIVSSPIGNLGDLSERARKALAGADLIACEDTRRSGALLAGLGLKKRLISMHDHNERKRLPTLLSELEGGATIAVLSDAGTPLLHDPGFPLVRAAVELGIRVEVVPGPSAVLAALVASALPPYPFTFYGYPPPRSGRRQRFFRKISDCDHTIVLFESPHRIVACVEDAARELGDRPAAICRELTKLHEEVLRGRLPELAKAAAERGSLKGEIVLVIGPTDS